VVPCYNEENVIKRTLNSLKQQKYPQDLFEIIVVNDGSTDDSLKRIMEVKNEMPNLVVIDLVKNRGKRNAVVTGIRKASGSIMMTIDSDTILKEDAIQEIVKPFNNPEVNGACGNTEIYNSEENIVTKMQVIYYWLGFNLLKASQSLTGTVTCLSGCINAYRRDEVLKFLDAFENQTFLGVPPTAGDDRSLTTFLLKRGGKTIFVPNAIAYTVVPSSAIKLLKQQLRWKRSFVRESVLVSTFIWKTPMISSLRFYTEIFLAFICPIALLRVLFQYWNTAALPFVLLGYMIAPILAVLYYGSTVGKFKPQYLLFGFLWTTVFMWTLPFAIITVNSRGWMTR
jgi:hyaluronan synthase